MNKETLEAFAEMQGRINEVEKKMDYLINILHNKNEESIEINTGAIAELAEIIGGE